MAGNDPKTVLIVDDEVEIVELVALLLETEGYRVETATNGQEGLERVSMGLPDLILLDMKMPVMDGWQFARAFHARYDHQVPIVVVTAADDARRRAEEIGAVDWVGKPFSLEALAEVVGHWLMAR